jgi:DNA-binding transcriptional LysR family regulator
MTKIPDALQETALQYFLEVVRTGSITAAASRLFVAPSAISRQIARLEASLDTLLFERRARGMVPNAAGELLAAHVRRSQQDIDRVTNDIHALRGLRQGKVGLVSTEGYSQNLFPQLVVDFQKIYPGISFQIDRCASHEVPQRIREGKSDIGLTLGISPELGVSVAFRHPAPIMALMAPTHPLASRPHLSLAELTGYPIALTSKGSTLRQLFDISCSRQSLSFSPVLISAEVNPLIAFATLGGGVTICGELAARARIRTGLLVAITLRDREMNERHVEIQTLAGRILPNACQAFLRHLQQAIVN